MLFESYRSNAERQHASRDYRGVLGLLAAVMIFDALQDTVGTLPALAIGGMALGALSNAGGEAAGSASAAAAATPAATMTPRVAPQPSLGLNLSPTAPTMGM
jgi:hypothetical protein